MMENENEMDVGPSVPDGVDLDVNDPLPDVPDAGAGSIPITSPDPIDFSTAGITAAGSVGMSTFNDGDDRTFFERTVEAFEEADVDSPMLGDTARPASAHRARTYDV